RLVHVGPLGDLPLPPDPGFSHIDPVPQQQLSRHYAEADVFVLASREEGLALVQAQALASGVPVVCTTRTGGVDLRDLLGCGDAVTEVPPDSPGQLAAAIIRAFDRIGAASLRGPREVTSDLNSLSWRAYGERYDRLLRNVVASRSAQPHQ